MAPAKKRAATDTSLSEADDVVSVQDSEQNSEQNFDPTTESPGHTIDDEDMSDDSDAANDQLAKLGYSEFLSQPPEQKKQRDDTARTILHYFDHDVEDEARSVVKNISMHVRRLISIYTTTLYDSKTQTYHERGEAQVREVLQDLVTKHKIAVQKMRKEGTAAKGDGPIKAEDFITYGSKALCKPELKRLQYGKHPPPIRKDAKKSTEFQVAGKRKVPVDLTADSDEVVFDSDSSEEVVKKPLPRSERARYGWPQIQLPGPTKVSATSSPSQLTTHDRNLTVYDHHTALNAARNMDASITRGSNVPAWRNAVVPSIESAPLRNSDKQIALRKSSVVKSGLQIDKESIERSLTHIYELLSSVVQTECIDFGADFKSMPKFAFAPSPPLNQLYTTIIGDHKIGRRQAQALKNLSVVELSMAVVGAFFHTQVFIDEKTPGYHHYATGFAASLGDVGPYVDWATIDRACREGYLQAVRTGQLQPKYVKDTAYMLSRTIASLLHAHLHEQTLLNGKQQPTCESCDVATFKLSDSFFPIMTKALHTMCELSVCTPTFEFNWPTAGDAFDAILMEAFNNTAKGVVAATLFPGITTLGSEKPQVVCKAQVFRAYV